MSETVKLIIEIDSRTYNDIKVGKIYSSLRDVPLESTNAIAHGTPLEDVKAEIETNLSWDMYDEYGNETRLHKELMEILDNIDKAESQKFADDICLLHQSLEDAIDCS